TRLGQTARLGTATVVTSNQVGTLTLHTLTTCVLLGCQVPRSVHMRVHFTLTSPAYLACNLPHAGISLSFSLALALALSLSLSLSQDPRKDAWQ
ncbi:hypothetical protein J6590_083571, partial [Homalodisca vitripennis]